MSSARILACFLLGIFMGRLDVLPGWVGQGDLVEYALYFMILCVGIGLGSELKAFMVLRDMHFKVLAVPVGAVVGTLGGAALASIFLADVSVLESMGVGSGLGYYSLSSSLVGSGTGNAALGSITLLANVLRELLGILTAPFMAKVSPLTTVGIAGAPAMDSCLPAIARFSGEKYAIIAVFSGVVLTIAVPFLVSFFIELIVA